MVRKERTASEDGPLERAPVVLVVDSDPEAMALWPLALGQRYSVQTFESPKAALDGLREQPADIIVSGYSLPEMSGLEFLGASHEPAPDAQRAMLVDSEELDKAAQELNAGAIDRILVKPIGGEELLGAVEKLWRQRALLLERNRLASENRKAAEVVNRFHATLENAVEMRTAELKRGNELLQQALREIEAKNQTLTELNLSLNVLATEDPLTGLFNRREFHHRLDNEWERFRRYSRPFSLIMLDIDHFKKINDEHGHDCGDVVLAKLGELLKYQKRRQDIVCRYGGEEFMVVLAETKVVAAVQVAEKLRKLVEQARFRCGSAEIPVRVSAGVSGVDIHHADAAADLVRLADMGLYRAKQSGRNRTVVVDPADPERTLDLRSG